MKALEGDLSEFPLTDIIQLVDLSKKTGAVHMHGKRGSQTLEGWLYFRDGKIIGAESPGLPPLEAVYTFFTFTAGPFHFADGVTLEQPTITSSNEVIIMEGIMRQDAWAEAEKQGPPLTMVPRLVPNPSSGTTEINLEAEEWRVLTMVNGRNTIDQIAQRSGLGEYRTREIIAELLANGLIEDRDSYSVETIIPELERIATNNLGANATVLLENSYSRANISDPASATAQQILSAIDYFEQAIASLVEPARARKVLKEMRSRAQGLVN